MSTTSLKLPESLKHQAVVAAKLQGVTPHAFMVEAIRFAATAAEQRARFVADAKKARATLMKSGKGYAAEEVHAHLRSRINGAKPGKLKAKSWRV